MKILVAEAGSHEAASLIRAASSLVASSIGYVETRSALGAAARAGRLPGSVRDLARSELERVWRGVDVVQLDDRLVAFAGDISERRRLRAGDAIHLTSALALDDSELVLLTWDADLRRAAGEVGLAVAP